MDRRWTGRRRGALGFVENYADLSDEETWHQTRTTDRRLLRQVTQVEIQDHVEPAIPTPFPLDFIPSFPRVLFGDRLRRRSIC
jgi:hypothetical protein